MAEKKGWKKISGILFSWMWEIQSDLLFSKDFGEDYAFRDVILVCEFSKKIFMKYIFEHEEERLKKNYQPMISAAMYATMAIVTDSYIPWNQFLSYMDVKEDDKKEIHRCNVIFRKIWSDLNYVPITLQNLRNCQQKYQNMDFRCYYKEMKRAHFEDSSLSYLKAKDEFYVLFPPKKCKELFLKD